MGEASVASLPQDHSKSFTPCTLSGLINTRRSAWPEILKCHLYIKSSHYLAMVLRCTPLSLPPESHVQSEAPIGPVVLEKVCSHGALPGGTTAMGKAWRDRGCPDEQNCEKEAPSFPWHGANSQPSWGKQGQDFLSALLLINCSPAAEVWDIGHGRGSRRWSTSLPSN